MAHPIYNIAFCKLGHKIIAGLIDESPHNRCTKKEVSVAMNASLKLDPTKDFAAVTEEVITTALRCGAFDTTTRAFWAYKGRYGSIRDAEVPEPKSAKAGKGKAKAGDAEVTEAKPAKARKGKAEAAPEEATEAA